MNKPKPCRYRNRVVPALDVTKEQVLGVHFFLLNQRLEEIKVLKQGSSAVERTRRRRLTFQEKLQQVNNQERELKKRLEELVKTKGEDFQRLKQIVSAEDSQRVAAPPASPSAFVQSDRNGPMRKPHPFASPLAQSHTTPSNHHQHHHHHHHHQHHQKQQQIKSSGSNSASQHPHSHHQHHNHHHSHHSHHNRHHQTAQHQLQPQSAFHTSQPPLSSTQPSMAITSPQTTAAPASTRAPAQARSASRLLPPPPPPHSGRHQHQHQHQPVSAFGSQPTSTSPRQRHVASLPRPTLDTNSRMATPTTQQPQSSVVGSTANRASPAQSPVGTASPKPTGMPTQRRSRFGPPLPLPTSLASSKQAPLAPAPALPRSPNAPTTPNGSATRSNPGVVTSLPLPLPSSPSSIRTTAAARGGTETSNALANDQPPTKMAKRSASIATHGSNGTGTGTGTGTAPATPKRRSRPPPLQPMSTVTRLPLPLPKTSAAPNGR